MSILTRAREALTSLLTWRREGLTDPYPEPEDDRGWTILSSGLQLANETDGKTVSPEDRAALRVRARRAVRFSPHGRSIMRSFTKYVTGGPGGVHIALPPEETPGIMGDPEKAREVIRFYRDRWEHRTNFQRKATEALRRGVRDGEVVLRRFATAQGSVTRFIDPEQITDPNNGGEDAGFVRDDRDPVTILAAKLLDPRDPYRIAETVLAQDLHVTLVGADENEFRGVTELAPVLFYVESYMGWVTDRITLNRIRSSVALVRKFDTTPGQMDQFLNREASRQDAARATRGEPKPGPQDTKQTRFRPGMVVNATKGITWEFITPNVQAADVQHDGRAIQLAIAAGTGLAEFMVSGDLSNGNYASHLVGEAVPAREFMEARSWLGPCLRDLWAWEVDAQVRLLRRGLAELPRGMTSPEVLKIMGNYDPTRAEIEWPEIGGHDRLKERQADKIMVDAGALSARTMAERDGIKDPEAEQDRIRAEREEAMAAVLTQRAGLGDAGDLVEAPPRADELETLTSAEQRLLGAARKHEEVVGAIMRVLEGREAPPPGVTVAGVTKVARVLSEDVR